MGWRPSKDKSKTGRPVLKNRGVPVDHYDAIVPLRQRSLLAQNHGAEFRIPIRFLLAGQLYGVESYDPSVVGLAAVILAACALFAASVPAQHAATVQT